MKKLLLLIATSSVGLSLSAQESKSLVFLQPAPLEMPSNMVSQIITGKISQYDLMARSAEEAQKATSLHAHTHGSWFDYWDQNSVTGHTLYYNTTAPDSNINDIPATGSPYHVFCHGLGVSFDPTDDHYYGNANTTPITETPITNSVPYTVDSFDAPFQYIRNNNTDTLADSLIIELVVTSLAADSGTYKLQFGASAANAAITTDSTPRFASCNYTRVISGLGQNEVWDSIKTTKQRYAFGLKLADTVGGARELHFALSSPINVPAGGKLISFMHLKSMHTTTLGTSTSANSNVLHLYSGTPEATSGTWPKQTPHSIGYPGSRQTGLIAQNQVRYSDAGFTYAGHNILIPGVAFGAPGWAVCYQSFHVSWTTMDEDGVANINKTINKTNAYPNPSTNKLNVAYDLAKISDVTVVLTNVVGQEVATQHNSNVVSGVASFNTADLSAGIYFYTVISNGERSTGRVTIAH